MTLGEIGVAGWALAVSMVSLVGGLGWNIVTWWRAHHGRLHVDVMLDEPGSLHVEVTTTFLDVVEIRGFDLNPVESVRRDRLRPWRKKPKIVGYVDREWQPPRGPFIARRGRGMIADLPYDKPLPEQWILITVSDQGRFNSRVQRGPGDPGPATGPALEVAEV